MSLKVLVFRDQVPGTRGTLWGPGWVVGSCLAQNLILPLGASEAGGIVFPRWKAYLSGAGELFAGATTTGGWVGSR